MGETQIIVPGASSPKPLFKFGKDLKIERDVKTPHFGNYGSASKISFPQVRAWERNISTDPLGNDEVGCCAEAAPGHAIQNMTMVANYGNPTQVTKTQVVKAYSDITGFDPTQTDVNGNNPTDNGSSMLDVCRYLVKTGIAGVKFDGFVALNQQNLDEIKAAINLFGWVFVGIVVPQSIISAMESGLIPPVWNYSSSDKATNNGHALSFFGYGRSGLAFNSWGTFYHSDNNFFLNWVDEAYALVSKAWLKKSGISPSGFDLQGLLADLPIVGQGQVN